MEMMIIALAPTYISKPSTDKGGIGVRRDAQEGMEHRNAFNAAVRRQATMNQLVHSHTAKKENVRLLAHTRAAGRLPSQASTSTVFAIDKKKGKEGIGGLRLLHCVCPFWRC